MPRLSPVKAISFDLDDTLWPIAPVIERAEKCLHAWLRRRFPAVVERYSREDIVELRQCIANDHPQTAHDFTTLRRLTLRHVMRPLGCSEQDVEDAYQVFFAARNQVQLYADVPAALRRLGASYRLASISNGNADLKAVGLDCHFEVSVSARDVGAPKPRPGIFEHTLARLGLEPDEVVHVGDDLELDVGGALAVGMHAVWINRSGVSAGQESVAVIRSLEELPELLTPR